MNNTGNSTISNILAIVLVVMVFILIALVITYIVLKLKQKNAGQGSKKIEEKKNAKGKSEKPKNNNATANQLEYGKQSIFNFMEFDDIVDNMIVQKDGKRYVMVIECQGVNYDLMSRIEKVAVEEGFQQFLNTLRYPIQIYIQTRTINLENSIKRYEGKVNAIERKYEKMKFEYERMKESNQYNSEQINKYKFELVKQRNLYEYGKDLLANTKKMSQNNSVLSKKFYLVVHYFAETSTLEKYDKDEIRNIAFSELYSRVQAMISTLSACSVQGKILNSIELAELLYMAYNRNEAEVYGIEKLIRNGNLDMYSTAPDVFQEKVEALNSRIQKNAMDLANEKIEKAKSDIQKIAEEREEQEQEITRELAKMIVHKERRKIGRKIANRAIKDIEEGGYEDEEE